MMGYETWLECRRDNPEDKEVRRVGKLKTIRKAEANAWHLRHPRWYGALHSVTVHSWTICKILYDRNTYRVFYWRVHIH